MKRLFLFLYLSVFAFAHPHVFVDVGYEVKIKPHHTEVNISWTLDAMNSQMLLFDFGIFSDEDITKEKIDFIEKEYFSKLSPYDYYTFITHNATDVDIPTPQNFGVSLDDNRLTYHFTLNVDIDATNGELKIGSFDAENLLALDIINAKTTVSTTEENLDFNTQIAFEDKDYFVVDVLIIKAQS